MAFMKRALEKQREEARYEAEKLMQALREEEAFDAEPGEALTDSEEESNGGNQRSSQREITDREEEKESEQASRIREALQASTGTVRRQKQKGKALDVTEHIAVKPLFEAPVVASLFDDEDGTTTGQVKSTSSNLLNDLEDESGDDDNLENDLLEGDEDVALLEANDENDDADADADEGEEEAMSGNPWLLAAEDNVGHSKERKGASVHGQEEESVDIAGTVAKLEVCQNIFSLFNYLIIYRHVLNKNDH